MGLSRGQIWQIYWTILKNTGERMYKSKLSDEFKIACEIYHHNINNEPIWLGKLVEIFDGRITKLEVWYSTDVLVDWMIAYYAPGSLGDGHAGFLWYIDKDAIPNIKELYENFWRDEREEKTR
jgi:hypothetical protein